jgi:Tol biopolymer transport system component
MKARTRTDLYRTLALAFGVVVAAGSAASNKPKTLVAQGESFSGLTPVTEGLKDCSQPAVSGEGAFIFVSTKDGNSDLYLKPNPTGAAVRKLTTHGAADLTPAIASDNVRVAFASNRSGNFDIFVLRTNGGAAKMQVTDSPDDEFWPSWSPDGKLIAYSRFSRVDGRFYIWVKNLETGANIQLGPGRNPDFSPSGDRILFAKAGQGKKAWYSLWTMDLQGGQLTQLTAGSEWGAIQGKWSPDAEKIVFASSKGVSGKVYTVEGGALGRKDVKKLIMHTQDNNIWVMNADGSSLTQLTTHEEDDYQPRWTRDNQIYFTSLRDGEHRIWRVVPQLTDGYTPKAPAGAAAPAPANPAAAAAPAAAAPAEAAGAAAVE